MKIADHIKFWSTLIKRRYPFAPPKTPTNSEITRLQHYIQLTSATPLGQDAKPANSVNLYTKTAYAYDWYRMFGLSDDRACHYLFGDVQFHATNPTFCKSRPISATVSNNVLLPLNSVRHYDFVIDHQPFEDKIARAVWRGAAYKKLRKNFLIVAKNIATIDAADTSDRRKHFLNKMDQLSFQLIFALEGNDVASNLKWIMGSNCAPVMTKPKFETWFCESQLIAGHHYIEIKDDFSDLEEKIDYYLSHPAQTREIAIESKNYATNFFNLERQFSLATEVIEQYFSLVN